MTTLRVVLRWCRDAVRAPVGDGDSGFEGRTLSRRGDPEVRSPQHRGAGARRRRRPWMTPRASAVTTTRTSRQELSPASRAARSGPTPPRVAPWSPTSRRGGPPRFERRCHNCARPAQRVEAGRHHRLHRQRALRIPSGSPIDSGVDVGPYDTPRRLGTARLRGRRPRSAGRRTDQGLLVAPALGAGESRARLCIHPAPPAVST